MAHGTVDWITLQQAVQIIGTAAVAPGPVYSRLVSPEAPYTTRYTAITPASGKRIKVLSIAIDNIGGDDTQSEVYFGTGVDIWADVTRALVWVELVGATLTAASHYFVSWHPDGAPMGGVDEVISVRLVSNITGRDYLFVYQEV